MRRVVSLALVLVVAAPLACGGESFDAPSEGEGDAVVDRDAGSDADSHADAESDGGGDVGEAGDAADADGESPDGDAADARDSCTPNECGGCSALAAVLGAACGACGDGRWACADKESLECKGARAPNACGGCAALPSSPGMSCGACGDGKWACDGVDAVTCTGARAVNACGGCSVLATEPGAKCGICGGGAFVCSGKDATVCSDPVATPPPGTTCGACGTQKYACAPDGKSTFCPKVDDRNLCGGCGAVERTPGSACGTCGIATCSADKSKTFCQEAATAPGTTCGVCSKSKFVCSAATGTTSCAAPDDRKSVEWGTGETTVTFADHVSPQRALGVEVTAGKTGAITSVMLAIERVPYSCPNNGTLPHPDPACTDCRYSTAAGAWLCSVPAPVAGTLTASLHRGAPGTLGVPVQSSFAANHVTLSSPGVAWVEFKLPTPVTANAGEKLYVELASSSTAYKFKWTRQTNGIGTVKTWSRTPGSTSDWVFTWDARPLRVFTSTCEY